jgi:hypothetical protein
MSMFKRDEKTGEEIAHHVTTPYGTSFVTGQHAHLYQDNPGYTVEEVRGHSRPDGFVIDRTVN